MPFESVISCNAFPLGDCPVNISKSKIIIPIENVTRRTSTLQVTVEFRRKVQESDSTKVCATELYEKYLRESAGTIDSISGTCRRCGYKIRLSSRITK